MTFKDDLSLAFKPKMLSNIEAPNLAKGLKPILYFFFIWFIIHIIIALINGVIDGQSLGGILLFSLLTGFSVAVLGLIGLLVLGFVSTYTSKIFGGNGDLQRTLGLISVGVLPIVLIGVLRDLITLVSTIGGHFLAGYLISINMVLFVITLVWLAWLLSESIAVANNIRRLSALLCFVLGFIVASIVNWPINWILVKVVTNILMGAL